MQSQLVITWEMVSVAVVVLLALFGLLVRIIKWLLDRYVEAVKAQIGMMATQITAHAGDLARLDKEILKLRAEVARDCFTRNDHIRYETVINAKVDALGTKIENLMLRSAHAQS